MVIFTRYLLENFLNFPFTAFTVNGNFQNPSLYKQQTAENVRTTKKKKKKEYKGNE